MASLVLTGDTSGTLTVAGPAVAGANTLTLPAVTDTLAPIVSGTAVSASGTSVEFTGIPSWVKRITVMFSGVSTNGTSIMQIQLGTSGGFVTSGYLGTGQGIGATSTNGSQNSSGFLISNAQAATYLMNGHVVLCSLGSNIWTAVGIFSNSESIRLGLMSGSVPLSGTLDRVRATTVNGTDSYDAGSINILYE